MSIVLVIIVVFISVLVHWYCLKLDAVDGRRFYSKAGPL